MDDTYFMPLVVIALVVLTLFMSWVTRKYQEQQAVRREAVKHIEKKVRELSSDMDILSDVPLPKEFRTLLRSEIVALYQAIGAMHKKYPGLSEIISDAKAKIAANDGPDINAQVPKVQDEESVLKKKRALNNLIAFLGSGAMPRLQVADVKKLQEVLGEQRAKLLNRFYTEEAARLNDMGDSAQARRKVYGLLNTLRREGPNTDVVRDLYDESHKLVEIYSPAPSPEGEQMADQAATR